MEVLKIFEEEAILAGLQPKMALLQSQASRFESLPQVGEFRRCGMVAAVEMVQDRQTRTAYPWQQRRGLEVYRQALVRGALLRPLGNVIYFMPPLTIAEDELRTLLDIAYEAIAAVTATP
jgi:adenosylmethionine-8-amino-7-oxononanoate aminotransferase